jgi:hypothetical protein
MPAGQFIASGRLPLAEKMAAITFSSGAAMPLRDKSISLKNNTKNYHSHH